MVAKQNNHIKHFETFQARQKERSDVITAAGNNTNRTKGAQNERNGVLLMK